ncbi:unnamed protein product [Medioppia subpectinata]|uniref:Uncharacterized protein n=1 Tax=Medioppia subpectinata TaxID=1979941 RepID=A0A7R9KC34_9ACAR|nr:unnamed protein product [Medioppia subpectinata]CAG2100568.1 unnamed protein product [Medioppia subpectinata]
MSVSNKYKLIGFSCSNQYVITRSVAAKKLYVMQEKHVDQPFSIPILKDVDEFNDYIEGINATSIEQGDSNGCYTCSSPCAMIYCCSGPYPQCCAVGGRCYCCR